MCSRSTKGPSQSRLAQMYGAVKRNTQWRVCSIRGSLTATGLFRWKMSYSGQFYEE